MCTFLLKLRGISRVLILLLSCWLGSQTGVISRPLRPHAHPGTRANAHATPVVIATSTSLTGASPLSVTFTAEKSYDPAGGIVYYEWDFGDDSAFGTTANPVHVYTTKPAKNGIGQIVYYTTKLTVIDSKGARSATQTFNISLAPPTSTTANRPPVAVATSTSLTGTSPLSVTFTADKSYDPDNDPVTYEWDFGDDSVYGTTANPVHVYTAKPAKSGIGQVLYYTTKLTVIDSKGARSNTQTFNISLAPPTSTTANRPPVAVATSTSLTGTSPLSVTFTANKSYDPDNDPITYEWDFGDDSVFGTTANPVHVYTVKPGKNGVGQVLYYTTKLTVIDSKGARSATQTFSISLLPPPPTPVTSFDPTKCYQIVSLTSNKVLSVENSSVADGAPIRQRSDAGLLSQRWQFQSAGDGYYKIVGVQSSKAIDVQWWGDGNDVPIQLYTAGDAWRYNQHFLISANNNGTYQLMARHSGKVLTVQNGNVDEGGMVVQYTPGGSSIQQWGIVERGCTTTPPSSTTAAPPTTSIDPAKCYRIQSRSSGLAMSVPNGQLQDGVSLKQMANADQLWQKWRLTSVDGSSYYNLTIQHSKRGIQITNSATTDNAPVDQWTYWGGSHQQWAVQRNSEGFYVLSNRNSGKVVAIRNASTADGADIVQQTLALGQQHQQWSLIETTCPASGRVGIEEAVASVSLSPNPAHDHVLIDLSSVAGRPVGLVLNDLMGRPTQQTRLDAAPVEPYRFTIGQVPDGLYLMQITPAGQSPTTIRLVIQR